VTILDEKLFVELADFATELGLLRLGVVGLDHPGFALARSRLDRFLAQGKDGTMGYLGRGRATRENPALMLEGARSLLVVAVPYRGEETGIARYAQSADYHTEMHRRLRSLCEWLDGRIPGNRSLVCVDSKPILERAAAVLAGLGFIGKHGGVIVPELGGQVLLGEILTTAQWRGPERQHGKVDAVLRGEAELWDACGRCNACIDACPTDAFEAPGDLDPRRCISYLTLEYRGKIEEELAGQMGAWIAGCDVCQDVCPYNQSKHREAKVPAAAWLPKPPGRPRNVDLARFANIGNNQHRAFVRHTALNRIPRQTLRRNALIALANGVGALEDDEREALLRAQDDERSEIREVARWAANRRGLADARSEALRHDEGSGEC